MTAKAVGVALAELSVCNGNPGSRTFRIVPRDGGRIEINLTPAEVRLLVDVLREVPA